MTEREGIEIPASFLAACNRINLVTIPLGPEGMARDAIRGGVGPGERDACRSFIREVLNRCTDQSLRSLLMHCGAMIYLEKPAAARFLLELMLRELSGDGS